MPAPVYWTLEFLLNRCERTSTGCIEWQFGRNDAGYGIVWIDGMMHKVHRVAWKFSRGTIPGGLFLCHRCDNRACCNVDHLFLGTALDNSRDMMAKGRRGPRPTKRGSANPNVKLSDADVIAIKSERAFRGYRPILASRYRVSLSAIDAIRCGASWKHIHPAPPPLE